MFDKFCSFLLDYIFMAMILITGALGTLALGL